MSLQASLQCRLPLNDLIQRVISVNKYESAAQIIVNLLDNGVEFSGTRFSSEITRSGIKSRFLAIPHSVEELLEGMLLCSSFPLAKAN